MGWLLKNFDTVILREMPFSENSRTTGPAFLRIHAKHLARYRSVLLGRFLFVWFVTLFAIGITPATWWGQLTMIFGSIFLGWGISSLHRIGRTYGAVVFFILASLVALLHGMPHPY